MRSKYKIIYEKLEIEVKSTLSNAIFNEIEKDFCGESFSLEQEDVKNKLALYSNLIGLSSMKFCSIPWNTFGDKDKLLKKRITSMEEYLYMDSSEEFLFWVKHLNRDIVNIEKLLEVKKFSEVRRLIRDNFLKASRQKNDLLHMEIIDFLMKDTNFEKVEEKVLSSKKIKVEVDKKYNGKRTLTVETTTGISLEDTVRTLKSRAVEKMKRIYLKKVYGHEKMMEFTRALVKEDKEFAIQLITGPVPFSFVPSYDVESISRLSLIKKNAAKAA